MKTDVIVVSSRGEKMEEALNQAEKFAQFKGLDRKKALHLRLLTEEMMGMMRSITGETEGEFWIEDDTETAELHLRVNTVIDMQTRAQLVAASTSGKNEATRTLMGKLRSFFDVGPVFAAPFMPGESAQVYGAAMAWSMQEYRNQLKKYRDENGEGAEEEWDELEKSVVSHVADEVKVRVENDVAEMIIYKSML